MLTWLKERLRLFVEKIRSGRPIAYIVMVTYLAVDGEGYVTGSTTNSYVMTPRWFKSFMHFWRIQIPRCSIVLWDGAIHSFQTTSIEQVTGLAVYTEEELTEYYNSPREAHNRMLGYTPKEGDN